MHKIFSPRRNEGHEEQRRNVNVEQQLPASALRALRFFVVVKELLSAYLAASQPAKTPHDLHSVCQTRRAAVPTQSKCFAYFRMNLLAGLAVSGKSGRQRRTKLFGCGWNLKKL
ncbi:MAG: hypothetical protein HYR56_33015 [Acidobacteria bacterium]|nr:hypothetical protein [Acidobacteriota bacterium]MBI3422102.1 hypothetical protein [Acidobacteriota bacterium]